ncbi:hypothetical protein LXL04_026614 [Taraxacum kok-saghyz]
MKEGSMDNNNQGNKENIEISNNVKAKSDINVKKIANRYEVLNNKELEGDMFMDEAYSDEEVEEIIVIEKDVSMAEVTSGEKLVTTKDNNRYQAAVAFLDLAKAVPGAGNSQRLEQWERSSWNHGSNADRSRGKGYMIRICILILCTECVLYWFSPSSSGLYIMHIFGTASCLSIYHHTRYFHRHIGNAHIADYDPIGESAGPVMRLYSQGFIGSPRELVTTAGSRGHRTTPVGTGPDVTGPYGASGRVLKLREHTYHYGDERSETRAMRDTSELSARGPCFADFIFCAGVSIWCDERECYIVIMMRRCLMVSYLLAADQYSYVFIYYWSVLMSLIRVTIKIERDHLEDIHRDRDIQERSIQTMSDYTGEILSRDIQMETAFHGEQRLMLMFYFNLVYLVSLQALDMDLGLDRMGIGFGFVFRSIVMSVFITDTRYYHCHTGTAHTADYDPIGESARLKSKGAGPDGTGPYGASGCVSFIREPTCHLGDEWSDTRGLSDHSEQSEILPDYDPTGESARTVMRLFSQGFIGSPKELVTTAGSQGHRATPVGTGPDGTGPHGASGCVSFIREPMCHLGDEWSDTRGLSDHSEQSASGYYTYFVACAGDSIWCGERECYIVIMMRRCLMVSYLLANDQYSYVFAYYRCVLMSLLRVTIKIERYHLEDIHRDRDMQERSIQIMPDYTEEILSRDIQMETAFHGEQRLMLMFYFRTLCLVFDCIILFQTLYTWFHSRPWTWIWAWIGWDFSDFTH